ncbi:hypothetical protein AB3Y40_10955 [Yoonia sp. R2331]|uniref:hypothetical protein n=1 Tax=Yoonia sp. R2331 TaxID=3237238 RepID=UPI0034E58419
MMVDRANLAAHQPQAFSAVVSQEVGAQGQWRTDRYRVAEVTRPDLLSCLIPFPDGSVSLTSSDWPGFASVNEIEVCLYQVATYLDGPQEMIHWLKSVGMDRTFMRGLYDDEEHRWNGVRVYGVTPRKTRYFHMNKKLFFEALVAHSFVVYIRYQDAAITQVEVDMNYK